MSQRILLYVLMYFFYPLIQAQNPDTLYNLISNGNFEEGNIGFLSDYQYNPYGCNPGEYSLTNNGVLLNQDFKNPVNGDHTLGDGYYLIVNSNGKSGKRIWRCKAFVLPNSLYSFSVYFCNLYKRKGTNSGFMLNGVQIGGVPKGNDPEIRITINNKQIGETDKDIFQMFKWLKATAEWYSGKDSGYVELCLENLNTRMEGNDLALDDIEFYRIKTMSPGFHPVVNETIMNKEYMEELNRKNKPDYRRIIAFSDLRKGDSLAPGIYTLYPTRKKETEEFSEEKKIAMSNLIFEKGKSDLLPDAKTELVQLASWMKKNAVKIRLEGHTDNIGDANLNAMLSEERVEKAKQYLVELGIEQTRIETVGLGGDYPIADNSDEETRKLNRRIKFVILKK